MIPSRAMTLARRSSRLGESATLKVSRKAAELRASGVEIVDLSAGEPDFASPPVAVEAARRALADGFTHYTPNTGIPRLREALSARYRADFDAPWSASDFLIGAGAKAALFEIVMSVVDHGTEVVLPAPYWVSFPEQISYAGGTVVAVPTSADDGYAIRADPILAAVTDATRMILLNSPSNPSGGTVGSDDLRAIVETAAARDIVVLCDETYERFVYAGHEHASGASLAREFPETVVVVGSFSKTWAMTGWRLGWAVGPKGILRAASNLQSHLTSNATSFAQVGAVAALEEADADVERMLEAFTRRRDLLVRRLAELPGCRCLPPAGAFYAFPNVSALYGDRVAGSVALAEFLLEEARVAVVPGAAFGDDGAVRLSFATSDRNLEVALDRLASAFDLLT